MPRLAAFFMLTALAIAGVKIASLRAAWRAYKRLVTALGGPAAPRLGSLGIDKNVLTAADISNRGRDVALSPAAFPVGSAMTEATPRAEPNL